MKFPLLALSLMLTAFFYAVSPVAWAWHRLHGRRYSLRAIARDLVF